jgi:hypothetical protein
MMGVSRNHPPVDLSAAMQSQLATMYEFNKFKEEVSSMVKTNLTLIYG